MAPRRTRAGRRRAVTKKSSSASPAAKRSKGGRKRSKRSRKPSTRRRRRPRRATKARVAKKPRGGRASTLRHPPVREASEEPEADEEATSPSGDEVSAVSGKQADQNKKASKKTKPVRRRRARSAAMRSLKGTGCEAESRAEHEPSKKSSRRTSSSRRRSAPAAATRKRRKSMPKNIGEGIGRGRRKQTRKKRRAVSSSPSKLRRMQAGKRKRPAEENESDVETQSPAKRIRATSQSPAKRKKRAPSKGVKPSKRRGRRSTPKELPPAARVRRRRRAAEDSDSSATPKKLKTPPKARSKSPANRRRQPCTSSKKSSGSKARKTSSSDTPNKRRKKKPVTPQKSRKVSGGKKKAPKRTAKKKKRKKTKWNIAISKARKSLGITGFCAIDKGRQGKKLYDKAVIFYNRMQKRRTPVGTRWNHVSEEGTYPCKVVRVHPVSLEHVQIRLEKGAVLWVEEKELHPVPPKRVLPKLKDLVSATNRTLPTPAAIPVPGFSSPLRQRRVNEYFPPRKPAEGAERAAEVAAEEAAQKGGGSGKAEETPVPQPAAQPAEAMPAGPPPSSGAPLEEEGEGRTSGPAASSTTAAAVGAPATSVAEGSAKLEESLVKKPATILEIPGGGGLNPSVFRAPKHLAGLWKRKDSQAPATALRRTALRRSVGRLLPQTARAPSRPDPRRLLPPSKPTLRSAERAPPAVNSMNDLLARLRTARKGKSGTSQRSILNKGTTLSSTCLAQFGVKNQHPAFSQAREVVPSSIAGANSKARVSAARRAAARSIPNPIFPTPASRPGPMRRVGLSQAAGLSGVVKQRVRRRSTSCLLSPGATGRAHAAGLKLGMPDRMRHVKGVRKSLGSALRRRRSLHSRRSMPLLASPNTKSEWDADCRRATIAANDLDENEEDCGTNFVLDDKGFPNPTFGQENFASFGADSSGLSGPCSPVVEHEPAELCVIGE